MIRLQYKNIHKLQPMNKKAVLGILLLVLIGGCLSKPSNVKQNNITQIQQNKEKTISLSVDEQNKLRQNKAIAKGDIKICKEIKNDKYDMKYHMCVRAVETSTSTDRFCGNFNCFLRNSIKDVSLCEKYFKFEIKPKQHCLYFVAKNLKDSSICNNIIEGFDLQNICFLEVAKLKQDVSVCQNIGKLVNKAVRSGLYNDSLDLDKNNCIKEVVEISQDVVKSNKLIIDCKKNIDTEYKERCLFQIAIDFKNPSLCDDLSFNYILGLKNKCYLELAKITRDASICKKIPPTHEGKISPTYQGFEREDGCRQEVVELTQDISLCTQMKNPKEKDACYKSIAYYKKDESICELMKDYDMSDARMLGGKAGCVSLIASLKKDKSICDKIVPVEYDCYYLNTNDNALDFLPRLLEKRKKRCSESKEQCINNI